MSYDDQSERPPGAPEEFEAMLHNDGWVQLCEEHWSESRIAPDIVLQTSTQRVVLEAKFTAATSVALQGLRVTASAGILTPSVTPNGRAPASPRIARPPAGRLIACLSRFLTRPAFERMIAPFIAQEQHEYYDALIRGEFWYARWIVVRMYLMIGYNVIAAVAASVINLVRRAG
jgi:hypothetical protein